MREIVFCIDLYLSAPAVLGKRIIVQIVFFAESHSRFSITAFFFKGKMFFNDTFIHPVSLDLINKWNKRRAPPTHWDGGK